MAPSGKWIDGIDADGSVAAAARVSLDARLAAVQYWLPRAAYLAEQDIEHVHRLRVSTRRAVAALRLYRDWLPRGPARWLEKRLRKIRRAAGDARDLDVLAQRLERDEGERAKPVLATIARRRAAVQPAIEDVAERCRRRGKFIRKAARLTADLDSRAHGRLSGVCFRDFATKQLHEAAASFFEAMPGPSAETEALHQLRIRAKALRYTIELVAPAFAPELKKKHYAVVEELQELLGSVQDHATASDRLREWAEEMHDAATQQVLRELAAEEGRRLEEQLQKFRRWWNPERAEALRQGLLRGAAGEPIIDQAQAARQT